MPVRRLPRPGLLVALALALLTTACSGGGGTAAPSPGSASGSAVPTAQRYVALGDSYTAAPGVPTTDLAGGCFRSNGNYPALVADRLGAELVDVSCSGADTGDMTTAQLGGVPPQLEALSPDTDLVTLGLGGNDGGLFDQVVSRCRAVAPPPGSTEPTGQTCPRALSAGDVGRLLGELRTTRASLVEVLREVRRRAPAARVLAVGYPQIVSAERGCAALPLADADRRYAATVNRALNAAVRRAAAAAQVEFLDVYAATRGHDICAAQPWVNGIIGDQRRAIAFHPFAEEQRAVAKLVLAAVG